MSPEAPGPAACITGLGVVSALGSDASAVAAALHQDRGGIGPITRFDASAFSAGVAGEVCLEDVGGGDPCVAFAVAAARQAWAQAGLGSGGVVPVLVGSSAGPHSHEDRYDALLEADPAEAARVREAHEHIVVAEAVARALGLHGPRLAPATACASGFVALALGLSLLRRGWPVVLAGGSEALGRRRLAGFHALGALAPEACAPFSAPVGMSLGEGAALFVLESGEHARARGARPLAWLRGGGLSTDCWHATAPDPRGEGMGRALGRCLEEAGLPPEAVDAYAAHGTGTLANDAAEWAAVQRVFGASPPAVLLPKALLGHSFGASGPQALALGLIGMREGRWPATSSWRGPRVDGPDAPPVVVAGSRDPGGHDVLLALNAAFGGANAAVLVAREAGEAAPSAPARRIFVGAAGQAGAEDALRELRRAAPRVDPRGLDRPGLLLTLAAARALPRPPRGPARDRWGLFTGVARRPVESGEQYRLSLQEADGARASASAFSRSVMNASTGVAARALGLRGPGATLAGARGAGLLALVLGVLRLEQDAGLDGLLVGAVDELPLDPEAFDPERPGEPAGRWRHSEAAAAVVLQGEGSLQVLGVGLAGPDAPELALRQAAGDLGIDRLLGSAGGPRGQALEARLAAAWGCVHLPAGSEHAAATTALARVAELHAEPLQGRSAVLSWCARGGAVAVVLEPAVSPWTPG